ncbi:MAG: sulfite exporter TauE/SafE family protein [Verrucomicrobiota bacterium]
MNDILVLTLLIFTAALLYSSVGHAGASGYLAAMALFGLAPAVMKPTALVLNLLVGTVGTIRFATAGHFDWKLFAPFAALSVPMAFLGGMMKLPIGTYKMVLGSVLLFAAWRLVVKPKPNAGELNPVSVPRALIFGAGLGLLSGLTGVGGGIFLSPLLLFLGWADVRKTAGVSVAFILVNSAAGLLGHLASVKNVPPEIVWWAPAALLGGIIGAELGSRRLAPITMRRLLSVVLIVAGVKMLLGK